MVKAVLLDLSGVLYIGDKVLPGAHSALEKIRRANLPIGYVTNTTRRSRAMLCDSLAAMHLSIRPDQLFTASQAALHFIHRHDLKPRLLIHPNLLSEFQRYAPEEENAVLIGDAGDSFTYQNLNQAFRLLFAGAPLIAMGYNRYFKEPDGFSLDVGPFVAALEFASQKKATITGKPSAEFFRAAIAGFHCDASEVVMVGDDAEADVCGACNAGLQGLLVRTGKYRPSDDNLLTQYNADIVADINAAADWILDRST